jgi:hypothetical protein
MFWRPQFGFMGAAKEVSLLSRVHTCSGTDTSSYLLYIGVFLKGVKGPGIKPDAQIHPVQIPVWRRVRTLPP